VGGADGSGGRGSGPKLPWVTSYLGGPQPQGVGHKGNQPKQKTSIKNKNPQTSLLVPNENP